MNSPVNARLHSRYVVSQKLVRSVATFSIFLSAFLLFSLQPFFAKMVLPRLGGSAAVWSVAVVFFQSVLLAGYGYAHFLASRFSLQNAIIIHLAVIAAAFVSLPVALPHGWASPPADGEVMWLIGLLSVSVGLPFFAVSANGPLLQSWFASSRHEDSHDPYFLYAASNIGSFASLFLYVLLIEPIFELPAQGKLWTAGFVLLFAFVALTGWLTMQHRKSSPPRLAIPDLQASEVALVAQTAGWTERLVWIGLAFIPSALLVAFTSFISTDIGAAPFLWILPLSLYLLTFVIVFGNNADWWYGRTEMILPLLIALVVILFTKLTVYILPNWFSAIVHTATFFFISLHCHGILARRRPVSQYLTQFYFSMSIGGVLGGIVVGLCTRHLFNWNVEYYILIIATFFLLKDYAGASIVRTLTFIAGLSLVLTVSALATNSILKLVFSGIETSYYAICFLLFLSIFYYAPRRPMVVPAICITLMMFGYVNSPLFRPLYLERNFYGQVTVFKSSDNEARVLSHGTTIHGAMRLKDADSSDRPVPLTYYTSDGGLNAAIVAARANAGGRLGITGIVGVGTGSLACQFQPGEKLEMVEIDPLVLRIAQDPQYFRFLQSCANDALFSIGDGRLVLANAPDAHFDHLIVDAFSSDAVPAHLLTVEAMDIFMRKIKTGGMLVLHLSNRHLDLTGVASANAKKLGWQSAVALHEPVNNAETANLASATEVAVLVRNREDFGDLLKDPRWKTVSTEGIKPWTDGYSNVLHAMWRRYVGL